MPAYNLISEKWIPCIIQNRRIEFGLQEVLIRAHEISEIYDPSPLVTVSLHRLLLAILHRNFGPENFEKWQQLWQKGRWDEKILDAYFQKWWSRFYLFNEDRPFYQTPEMPDAKKHPVLHLAAEISTGNNTTLFDHNMDDKPTTVSAAAAARYLVAAQAFSIGFGRSYPFYFSDAPLVRGITFFNTGNNLFETLLLNMVIYNEFTPFKLRENDFPTWESDQLPEPDKNGTPVNGYLDYLTWQSRKIHLYPEPDNISVRYCQIQQNLKLPDSGYFDPFKCYQKDEKRGWVPLNIQEDRVIWRDSYTLFQTTEQSAKRPEIFNLLAHVEMERRNGNIKVSKSFRLCAVGLSTEAGKAANIRLWRYERLPLPLKYLEDENLLTALKLILGIAEKAGREINSSLWTLAKMLVMPEIEQLGKEQKATIDKMLKHFSADNFYWAQLGTTFPQILHELAEDNIIDGQSIRYGDNTIPRWATIVKSTAIRTFRSVTNDLDQSARVLKAVTMAEIHFRRALNQLLSG